MNKSHRKRCGSSLNWKPEFPESIDRPSVLCLQKVRCLWTPLSSSTCVRESTASQIKTRKDGDRTVELIQLATLRLYNDDDTSSWFKVRLDLSSLVLGLLPCQVSQPRRERRAFWKGPKHAIYADFVDFEALIWPHTVSDVQSETGFVLSGPWTATMPSFATQMGTLSNQQEHVSALRL